MNDAGLVAQHDGAKGNRFNHSGGAVDDGDVADANLVFQQQKKSADKIAH